MAARFTPTCVGTTSARIVDVSIVAVHPHVRGDNADYELIDGVLLGSPPRAWGQLVGHALRSHLVRFTPTHVGTTGRG